MGLQSKLFQKILKVSSGVEKIEKSGYNAHQKYHYSTEQDLINSIRNLLIENKLIVLTDSETKEVIKLTKTDKTGGTSESLVTVVNTRHTFCDTETGATYCVQSTGAGHDPTDKGVFKGITGSFKYFVSKNFLVPTEDDPENDGVTKPTPVVATKGFNRPVSSPVEAKAQPEVQEVVKVEPPPPVVARPGFGRRTTLAAPVASSTKTEPSFP